MTAIAVNAPTQPPVPQTGVNGSRWSWLWLCIGAVLLPFTILRTVVPLAGWLAPIFLLRFARNQRAVVALPVLAAVTYAATLIAFRGVLPTPQVVLLAVAGLLGVVPYAVDRMLAPRLRTVLRTLVFPAADVSIAFAFSHSGFGSMGASAYAQVGNLPLTQVVSVVGIWGLGFLLAWTAPVVNELWDRRFDLSAARRVAVIFGGVLATALLVGGTAVAFAAPASPTVQVAGLAPDRLLDEAAVTARAQARPLPAAQRAELHQRYLQPVIDDLFRRTEVAARGGAKIVVWSEAASFVFAGDEGALIQRAREVASTERIYLQIGFVAMLPRDSYPFVDIRAVMISPDGAVAYDYVKSTQPLDDGNAPGPGVVPVIDTSYGRVATVICHDANYPTLVRQAGQAGADILLVPSSDWAEVTEPLARTAALRAVENGVNLIRPTRRGTSTAVDYQGRQLGQKADYFFAGDQTMIVHLPTAGVRTLYPLIGDAFAYLAIGGLVVLGGYAFARRKAIR